MLELDKRLGGRWVVAVEDFNVVKRVIEKSISLGLKKMITSTQIFIYHI